MEQTTHVLEKEPRRDESNKAYFMVQGIDSLELHFDTHLDNSASSFNDDHDSMDAHALNEEFSLFCDNLLEKDKLLKKKSFDLKEENKNLFSKLDLVLQEKVEIFNERDSLKTQLDLVLKKMRF